MTTHATLYYEVHVTIDPCNDLRLPLLKSICDSCGYRIAKLIMRKGGKGLTMPYTDDMFMTTRGGEFEPLVEDLRNFARMLTEAHFHVRRYKIEDTVVDSSMRDDLQLLVRRVL